MSWPWALLVMVSFTVALVITLAVDGVPHLRSRWRTGVVLDPAVCDDRYAVAIPIYGHIRYLTTCAQMAAFGDRILLCTTDTESDQFYRDLNSVCARYGFRQLRVTVDRGEAGSAGQRSTSAPIRDQVMALAVEAITDEYVICIDADTVPTHDFAQLIGAMASTGIDVASVVLTPSNRRGLLEVFQTIEYQVGMVMRRVWPWVLSGGCHAARTACYREIMHHHSTFFQGNDVEVGILARQLGYTVGHVRFTAATDVPATVKDWWRQRWAWCGGEFRLAIVNARTLTAGFALYMTGFVYLLTPARWWWIVVHPHTLMYTGAAYLTLIGALWWTHRRTLNLGWRSVLLLLYPAYSIISSLLLATLSPYSYLKMAREHDNWGIITLRAHPCTNVVAPTPDVAPGTRPESSGSSARDLRGTEQATSAGS